MAWTTPRTWTTGEVLTAAQMNEQLRDNLEHLHAQPTSENANTASSTTTSSASYVDMTTMSQALTVTAQSIVFVAYSVQLECPAVGGQKTYVKVTNDDGDVSNEMYLEGNQARGVIAGFVRVSGGQAPGTKTYKLRWKTDSGGTATAYARRITVIAFNDPTV